MDPRLRPPVPPQRGGSHGPQLNSHQARPVPPSHHQPAARDATLNVVRQQIDRLYDTSAPSNQPLETPHTYKRSHNPQPSDINTDQWQKYHSSWQNYYQKYYEQYYIREMRKSIEQQATTPNTASEPTAIADKPDYNNTTDETSLTQRQAIEDLRHTIRSKAQTTAKKARKSRHFMPIASAIVVVAVFALLQYNQVLIANVKAYVSPANVQPENIIVDPNATVPVGPETKMIIPKINVDAPIVMNVGPTNAAQMKAMANGIAHVRYPGAASEPGQVGNAVFSAHSSSDWLDTGKYKFIFVQLERLAKGDVVYINYKSKQYAYKVYDTKVVAPTDTSALRYTGNNPIITLITCVPLGTAQHRLLVFAKQISPDPAKAKKAPHEEAVTAPNTMTGTPPTFLERLFGAG